MEKRHESRKEHEPRKEEEREIDEIISDYRFGKWFYYLANNGRWKTIRGLEKKEHSGRPILLLTLDEGEGMDIMSVQEFKKLQELAKKSGGAEFADRERIRGMELRRIDMSDTSRMNKERILETKYTPIIAEKLGSEFIHGLKTAPSTYTWVIEEFQNWAKGEDLDTAQRYFTGWKAADFVEMLKMFDEKEKYLRSVMEHDFEEEGIDMKATRKLIERAREAEKKLEKVGAHMLRSYGVVSQSNPFH